ncbi:MAG: rhomboid family intramembrane serine protease [Candidatus Heimdallarchaeota archaeon]|nr:rhomboid family intramembrane serine protease [Candidatus Heimdallarchaeota archaeon]
MEDSEYFEDTREVREIDDVYKTATFELASINFVMYIITSIVGGSIIITGQRAAVLFGVSIDSVLNGAIWTPITSIFTHGSISHLGFNLIYLFIFGFKLEERGYNKNGIYFIYIVTGVGAGILSLFLFFSPTSLTLGASGAVFGLLGANVGISKKNNEPTYKRVLFFSVFLFIFSSGENTNVFAHLLGLIIGYFIGMSDYIENYNDELTKFT